MTVKELIETLQTMDENKEVIIESTFGTYEPQSVHAVEEHEATVVIFS